LEKTLKIIKSSHQPITTMTAKPCSEVPRLVFLFGVFMSFSRDFSFVSEQLDAA